MFPRTNKSIVRNTVLLSVALKETKASGRQLKARDYKLLGLIKVFVIFHGRKFKIQFIGSHEILVCELCLLRIPL